jgi:hypothetical protein
MRAVSLVRWTFVRRPEEQAICAFVIRAIAERAPQPADVDLRHASLAMMITFVLPDIIRFGPSALAAPTLAALALPSAQRRLTVGIRISSRSRPTCRRAGSSRPRRSRSGASTPRRKALLLLAASRHVDGVAVRRDALERRARLGHTPSTAARSRCSCAKWC